MSDHFLWRRFHDNPAIDQTRCCFSLTNQILWNFGLTNQISLSLSSRPSPLVLFFTFVSFFCREHELQSHISRFRHFASQLKGTGCYFVETLKRPLWHGCYKVAVCGIFWHKVTAMDKSLWNRIVILLLVLLVLSAFPVLKNKRVLYIVYIWQMENMTKKLVKKVQLDTGSEKGTRWGGVFRTERNISQSV